MQLLRLPDGTIKALVEGKRRAKIVNYLPNDEFFRVEVEELHESAEVVPAVEAFVRQIREALTKLGYEVYGGVMSSIARRSPAKWLSR